MTASGATRVVVIAPSGPRVHDVPHGEEAVIGRAKDCAIVVDLPSISRHHARLVGAPRPTIEDLGGAHGLRIAGRRVMVGEPTPMNRGEVVDLGGAMLVIHPADEPTVARWDDHLVELLAQTDLSVVVMGESGVGKSESAQALIAAAGGNMKLLDDVVLVPKGEKERFVATTRRHDVSAPPGTIALLIPPLRDRPREIAGLAARVLDEASTKAGRRRSPRISREALGMLVRHSWLGNLRELRSTMEKALEASEGREIEPKHLVFESAPLPPQTMQTLPTTTSISSYPPPRNDR